MSLTQIELRAYFDSERSCFTRNAHHGGRITETGARHHKQDVVNVTQNVSTARDLLSCIQEARQKMAMHVQQAPESFTSEQERGWGLDVSFHVAVDRQGSDFLGMHYTLEQSGIISHNDNRVADEDDALSPYLVPGCRGLEREGAKLSVNCLFRDKAVAKGLARSSSIRPSANAVRRVLSSDVGILSSDFAASLRELLPAAKSKTSMMQKIDYAVARL